MKTPRLETIVLAGILLAIGTPQAAADVDVVHEDQVLLPNDGVAQDWFGNSVAHEGTTVLVGSRFNDNGTSKGSAYLMNAETGAQIAKLLPSGGEVYDSFAISVDISGNTAIVGSWRDNTVNGINSGSAYLYNATTGLELMKLLPLDGAPYDSAGFSVAISGSTAIVGCMYDDENGLDSGSAYLFDTTTGDQIAKLLPSDGAADDQFGRSVAISGDVAIVGASRNDDNGPSSGSAYLFDTTTGDQLAKLLPSDGAEMDNFGYSVSISETMAAVGAYGDDDTGGSSGSVYVYHVDTATELVKLQTSYINTTAQMGASVSLSGTTVVAGAHSDDDNDTDSGSAIVFDLQPGPPGTPYCFGDGTGTACPCGNTGGPGEGCANSTGVGAVLSAVSTSSVTDGEFALWTYGLPAGPGLYFQGDNMTNSGNGVPFGDGLRCAGGNVIRIEIRLSTSGLSRTTVPIAITGEVSAGDTKHYQLWYRDPVGSPCGTGFNLSNGYKVLWMP